MIAYAVAVDDRDYDLLGDLFTDDATLTTPVGEVSGRAAIVEALHRIERFESTFHQLGQSWFWVDEDDDTVNGDTYCTATHFQGDHVTTMYIRYADEFVLTDNEWRLSSREVNVVREVGQSA